MHVQPRWRALAAGGTALADIAILAANFLLGVFAFFSPCGFPMLPAYVAYYLPRGEGAHPSLARALGRGVGGGILAALGALLVLGIIGALAIAIGSPFKQRVVLLDLIGGLVVLTLGILLLTGKGPSFKIPFSPAKTRGALGILGFGALYAGVAASCVAPVFIGVVVAALHAPTTLDAVLEVGAYAAGLATLLLLVTILISTAQDAVVRAMKRVLPYTEKVSGALLTLVGLYLVSYWARVEGLV